MVKTEFYYDLLDKLSIVAITDKRGKITYANDKFCAISGYSKEELIGADHRIVNSGYHHRSFFIKLWKTISSGQIWRDEIRNRAKDGTYYWVDTFIIPEVDERNQVLHYYSLRIDITERKIKERELNNHKEELDHIRLLQSHEIRRPVANISGLLDLFDTKSFSQNNLELYSKLKKSIEQLENSIKEIVTTPKY
jgi:PAS domain S-box-containing protein